MKEWDMTPPPPSDLGDHDVFRLGNHLVGKRVALMVTGGIAAMKAPLVARSLRQQGAEVVAYVSSEALRYTTTDALEWSTTNPVVTRLSAYSEHLSDSTPFDLFLVAPATYNTINKMATGIADGVITTTLGSAIGRMEQGKSKVLVAPTMHNSLHNVILTESLKKLKAMGVRIIPPREANGKHNLPDEKTLTAEVCRAGSSSALKGCPILVTGGPTPVPIDNVRRIVNRFRGKLGVKMMEEFYLRGADVLLIHGDGGYLPPKHLPYVVAKTYDDYYYKVMAELEQKEYGIGIFSAGVADYKPEKTLPGKTPSGKKLSLNLIPTVKVIDEVKKRFPHLFMLTFKYQENISHNELMEIAYHRLNSGYPAIVANRGEEVGANGEQIAHLVTGIGESRKLIGKQAIAVGIADYFEEVWRSR
ncbi:MAG: phosphopantothenoylcysteine decarboxylase [Candidatus Parabeggiatoa sp. nov. 2]|nr:MAG: phosphopantothenoylcysteine decarboxylase [Beggiatoa sp. 4572_84]RKZ51968.1 MAG: phosphopantothenoylcysteine decarboxylase [Gammaproteobacteria bacterium]HEC84316.1 phosphopantothenoylcysteine decarboxylase [Thioploca sp.]